MDGSFSREVLRHPKQWAKRPVRFFFPFTRSGPSSVFCLSSCGLAPFLSLFFITEVLMKENNDVSIFFDSIGALVHFHVFFA